MKCDYIVLSTTCRSNHVESIKQPASSGFPESSAVDNSTKHTVKNSENE